MINNISYLCFVVCSFVLLLCFGIACWNNGWSAGVDLYNAVLVNVSSSINFTDFTEEILSDLDDIRDFENGDGVFMVDLVERFVVDDVPYVNESIVFDPDFTLRNGGDCKGKAVLGASLLLQAGFEDVYLLLQEEHICWGIRSVYVYEDGFGNSIPLDSLTLFNCANGNFSGGLKVDFRRDELLGVSGSSINLNFTGVYDG